MNLEREAQASLRISMPVASARWLQVFLAAHRDPWGNPICLPDLDRALARGEEAVIPF
jgi:hypothetical protein